jgi:MerR family copper efflux transcriptional regulator
LHNEGYSAGELARLADVNIQTLRYYERQGLVADPPRTAAGHRRYPESTLVRVRFIRSARRLGFSLADARALLELEDAGTQAEVREQVQHRLDDVERRLLELQTMRRGLVQLLEACHGDGPSSECPILDALHGEET